MSWMCAVCGFVHEGPEPPELCPVCSADKNAFSLMGAPAMLGLLLAR
ncbi:MAG: rubredoxin-like domain-containing protein [Candidatus Xenobia bacterium]